MAFWFSHVRFGCGGYCFSLGRVVFALAAWRAAVGGGEAMSEAKPGRERPL
jgi:hypothetical protein